jgi:hypothetical protein
MAKVDKKTNDELKKVRIENVIEEFTPKTRIQKQPKLDRKNQQEKIT